MKAFIFIGLTLVMCLGSSVLQPKITELTLRKDFKVEETEVVVVTFTLDLERKDVLNFLDGIVEGFAQGLQFKQISSCIKDDKKIAAHILKAIQYFQATESRDIKAAFKALAEAVKVIPVAIKECKAAVADIETLIAMIKKFESPGYFIWTAFKNLVVHGVEIYKDVKGGIESWAAIEYYKSGNHFGIAIARVFFDVKKAPMAMLTSPYFGPKTWVSGPASPFFENLTLWEFKSRYLGLRNIRIEGFPQVVDVPSSVINLPESFDGRVEWFNCGMKIKHQDCSVSWALVPIDILETRACLASKESQRLQLSSDHLVFCDEKDHGCDGGYLDSSWRYLEANGVESDECWMNKPFNIDEPMKDFCAPCDKERLRIKAGSIKVFKGTESIKAEIYVNGPVEASIRVFSDLMNYRSGVYHYTTGPFLGYQAVKIVGWGNEDNVPYWIVANSWGTTWGEDGYFRIKANECGIEDSVIGALPEL